MHGLRTLYIIGKNVGVRVFQHLFFPLPLCKAETITVIVCLKTGEEKSNRESKKERGRGNRNRGTTL